MARTAAGTTMPVETLEALERDQAKDHEELTRLAARHATILQLTSWNPNITGPSADVVEQLRAAVEEQDVRKAVLRLRVQTEERGARIAQLQAEAREQRRAEFRERKRAPVKRVAYQAAAFEEENARLRAIEDEELAACGSVDRISWHELDPETPQAASRIADWRRHVAAQGFDL